MGLCKCERKKVTNLFCFEHRVNVCEFCLMLDHSKCVVKSYLHWLKDNEYSSQCPLCSQDLNNGDECVRLMCLDILHWDCLDAYASRLPPTTTSAGYECPVCSMALIPLANQGGPIAEALRQRLVGASWARPNLKNSLANSVPEPLPPPKAPSNLSAFIDTKLLDSSIDEYASQFLRDQNMITPPSTPVPKPMESIVVPIEHSSSRSNDVVPSASYFDNFSSVPNRLMNPRNLVLDDADSDKYRPHPSASFFKSRDALLSFSRCVFSLVPRSLFSHRLPVIFGLTMLVCIGLLILLNLVAVPSPPENVMAPVQGRFRVGI